MGMEGFPGQIKNNKVEDKSKKVEALQDAIENKQREIKKSQEFIDGQGVLDPNDSLQKNSVESNKLFILRTQEEIAALEMERQKLISKA